jgi:transcriptional regulator with XRE-family HTH domain
MRTVDPAFPERLRALREAKSWSLRDLSRAAYVGKSTLSELENRQRGPSLEMAEHLDDALEAGGTLAALVTESRQDDASAERAERINHALLVPRLVDAGAVAALTTSLASSRRLDDSMEAVVLLPSVTAQLDLVQALAREARGPHAHDLRLVAAEWRQFTGWLHAQARNDVVADRMLRQSATEALELDAAGLACQAHGFRGYLARQRRDPRAAARAFAAAAETEGINSLQRVDALLNTAHAVGASGERREALRVLHTAADLTTAAESDPVNPATYWLTPDWLRIPLGMAHLGLGEPAEAVENLRHGLQALPTGWEEAEWAAEYRDALDEAEGAA